MSKQINPTIIGLFILGAFTLGIGVILFFGSTHIFTPQETFIVCFEESVNGLDVGAPVKFKGVPIGEVSQILINFNDQHTQAYIPVVIKINKAKLHDHMGTAIDLKSDVLLNQAIANGLRARLQLQSFLTGMLFIELNYFTDVEPAAYIGFNNQWREIPTIASGGLGDVCKQASKMLTDISKVNFKGMSEQFMHLLIDVRASLHELNFKDLNASIQGAAQAIEHFANSDDLLNTLACTKTAMKDFSTLTMHIDNGLDPLVQDFEKSLNSLLDTSSHFHSMLEPESAFRYQLSTALEEFSQASQSVRELADFLERNPQAVLKGKPTALNHKNITR